MKPARTQRPRLSHWAVALSALAILVRVLIPSGVMPTVNAGRVELVVCTGHGVMGMTASEMAPAHSHGAAKPAQSPALDKAPACPFAAASTPGLGTALVADADQIAPRQAPPLTLAHPDLTPGRGLAAPPPPPQAPPTVSV